MSNVGFSATRGISSGGPDKVDMSLDDIIRLNKKEQEGRARGIAGHYRRGRSLSKGSQLERGPGDRLKNEVVYQEVRYRERVLEEAERFPLQLVAAGVKGLSLDWQPGRLQHYRKASVRSTDLLSTGSYSASTTDHGPSTTNDGLLSNQPNTDRCKAKGGATDRQTYRDASTRRDPFSSGDGPCPLSKPREKPARPRFSPAGFSRWRTSTTSSGILTVSIDNPTAMTQSEPPCAWSLHPSAPTSSAPVKMKVEEEKKTEPPKGVPLQFDINSVGKPTAMTLNERFRILKDERGPAKAADSSLWVKTMTQRRRGIPKTFVSQTDTHTDTDPHLSDDIEAF